MGEDKKDSPTEVEASTYDFTDVNDSFIQNHLEGLDVETEEDPTLELSKEDDPAISAYEFQLLIQTLKNKRNKVDISNEEKLQSIHVTRKLQGSSISMMMAEMMEKEEEEHREIHKKIRSSSNNNEEKETSKDISDYLFWDEKELEVKKILDINI